VRVPPTIRRQLLRGARRGIEALPDDARELVRSMATQAAAGPTLLPGPPAGPVLVIAPHPDDEAIGPGATLARHHDRGDLITVLVVTSGGATAGGSGDITALREAESRRALGHLAPGVEPVFGRLPDGGLPDEVDAVADLIDRHGADAATVYVPSSLDPHPDHRAAGVALGRSQLADDVLVCGYEVWAAGPVNALVDVTTTFARKQAALAEYHVALETVDYVRSASGLAAYRSALGMLGGRGFAEGFSASTLGEHRARL
jgi:N-acetylglucosamine malate deacetylase 1